MLHWATGGGLQQPPSSGGWQGEAVVKQK